MSFAWTLFHGRLLHMTEREILTTPVGLMNDMVACYQIHKGIAKAAAPSAWDRLGDDEAMLPNLL